MRLHKTYIELKKDAVVWVEVLERHRTGFLQTHSIGKSGGTLICV